LLPVVLQEQELEAMKARLADMEKEAAKLKEMQVQAILLVGEEVSKILGLMRTSQQQQGLTAGREAQQQAV
jgi:hypothetical protein